jgi:hypothetical protein
VLALLFAHFLFVIGEDRARPKPIPAEPLNPQEKRTIQKVDQ